MAKYCILVCFNALKNVCSKLLVHFNFAICDSPFNTFDVLTILLPHTYVNSISQESSCVSLCGSWIKVLCHTEYSDIGSSQ